MDKIFKKIIKNYIKNPNKNIIKCNATILLKKHQKIKMLINIDDDTVINASSANSASKSTFYFHIIENEDNPYIALLRESSLLGTYIAIGEEVYKVTSVVKEDNTEPQKAEIELLRILTRS